MERKINSIAQSKGNIVHGNKDIVAQEKMNGKKRNMVTQGKNK